MREKGIFPGTIDGMKHVCYFRHALALDERRVKFLPEYVYGGRALRNTTAINHEFSDKESVPTLEKDKDKLPQNEDNITPAQVGIKSTGNCPQTKEVWFAGTHCDM